MWLCLALHVDRNGISAPGIASIMRETGYGSKSTVCSALAYLCSPEVHLVERLPAGRWGADRYRILGYAWFGREPAAALFEMDG